MKLIILFIISFIAFSEAIEAVDEVTDTEKMAPNDPCPIRMNCRHIKIVCPPGTVFDSNRRGCCCRPLCTGVNEIYSCECFDRVCNELKRVCKRCTFGCYCKPGFVRDPITKKCIDEKLCYKEFVEDDMLL